MIANAIFLKIFWHLKVTQPFMCFRVNQVNMFLSQSNIFISSPRWIFISFPVGFVVSPVGFFISLVENLVIGLTPEKFWKFVIFPGESSSPYQGTETGCLQKTLNKCKCTLGKYFLEFHVLHTRQLDIFI